MVYLASTLSSAAAPRIYEHTENNSRVENMPDIHFFVRMPESVPDGQSPDGIFLYVTYIGEQDKLKKFITDTVSQTEWAKFAEKHRLAIVTWTTATLYSLNNSFNEKDHARFQSYNDMEASSRSWNRAMNNLGKKYHLPEKDYLIYGISRGAQWAHRIALREPERFLAIQAHVNSTFEEPVPKAKSCLWLITTGDREYGYDASRIFYKKCRDLGYPILYKAQENLAHESSPKMINLGIKFFEHALLLKQQRQELLQKENEDKLRTKTVPASGFPPSLLQNFFEAPYTGDLLNGDVYQTGKSKVIPETLRVPIPTREIAEAWGYMQ